MAAAPSQGEDAMASEAMDVERPADEGNSKPDNNNRKTLRFILVAQ